tara:strand:+ start:1614 stop:2195 length:582 start_codon:yes stop_codon:yes gene_type:complete
LKSLLFFSHNQKKIAEVKQIFNNSFLKINSLKELKKIKEPKENGKTFAENAKIKSLFGFKIFNIPCFADDSGICVNALRNKPGIYSKRFLRSFKTKNEAFKYIISATIKKNDNRAFFNTTICMSLNINQHIFFVGKISGTISDKPKGSNGFGYDPIFIPSGFSKTFAEMSNQKKNLLSHRMIAIKKMESFLIN